jgi:hypothetical protein
MRTGFIVLVLALVVAVWRSEPPAPQGVTAPASVFSAARAFTDIAAIAQKPHPVGSAEHARVRDYIIQRMTALGLAPRLQSERSTRAFGAVTVSAPVTNIIGTLPGKDRSQPAVVIMSHYDTVPDSPGAADDTAGVAASLEIARALKSNGVPARDVIFLITDGEELGLMGAAAFFHHDALAAHVGAVINFETRGDSGLANMFETGPANADAIALYAANVRRPAANSLSRAIYKHMPNGTDLSVALERGLPALNFAFIGDEAAYHSPLATPAHLDLGSVQHMGDQSLAAARAFIVRLPVERADAVFSDVLGFFLIQYPLWFGWIVLAAAAGLAVFGIRAAGPAAWGRGVAAALLAIVVPAVALVGAGFGDTEHFLRLAHFDFRLAGAGALAIGLALVVAALYARRDGRPAAIWQVLLVLLLLLGAAAQALVPEAAFALAWPALIGGAMACVRFGWRRAGIVPLIVCSALALVQLAMTIATGIALFTAVGVDLPVVLVLPLLTGLPVLLLLPQEKSSRWAPLAIVAVGVVLFAYGRFAGPTAERPAPSQVRYVKDLDNGKAYRVSFLGAVFDEPNHSPLPWTGGREVWWAPVDAVNAPDTDVVMLREGGKLRIAVQPRSGAFSLLVTVKSATGLAASSFEGDAISPIKAGVAHELRYYAPGPEGLSWLVEAPKGKVEVKVVTLYPRWPADAAPLPPLPNERMAFGNHAATETVKRRVWTP